MVERRILAMGGAPDDALLDHALRLAGGPRVLYVGTAAMENEESAREWQERLAERGAEPDRLLFAPWPPDDLRERALASDLILVGGGNTANMLAIWRVHGFDRILREAWETGILLTGWSAGMICWFEAGVTDSFGPALAGMTDGLGFLAGSACPHYDGEELRRPVYRRLVAEGFPPGVAADDSVGLHFVGTELREAVTTRAGAGAYRIAAGGERPIEARLLA